MTSFTEVPLDSLRGLKRARLDDGFTLVAFGDRERWDGATVPWSQLASVHKPSKKGLSTCPMVVVYLPPFVPMDLFDRFDTFSVSVPKPGSRPELIRFSRSDDEGRVPETSLTPFWVDGAPCFDESRVTYVCRKLNVQSRRGNWPLSDEEVNSHCSLMPNFTRCAGEILRVLKATE